MRSSLDYAARGFAYNDSWLFGGLDDSRGQMLEVAWERGFPWQPQRINRKQPYLSDWTIDARNLRKPGVIFNTTCVESGSPVVFATTAIHPDLDYRKVFDRPQMDVKISSAVRSSASFPFVTPPVQSKLHKAKGPSLVDGGYFDNTGVSSMVRWLEDAIKSKENLPANILFVRILMDDPSPFHHNAKNPNRGTYKQAMAPFETVLNLRSGHRPQTDIDLSRLIRFAETNGVEITVANFVYPDSKKKPLSWHLTRTEMHEVASIRLDGHSSYSVSERPLEDLSSPDANFPNTWLPRSQPQTQIQKTETNLFTDLYQNYSKVKQALGLSSTGEEPSD